MQCSSTKCAEDPRGAARTPLAKLLAPEDVRAGDYVTLLSMTYELPSFYWDRDASLLPAEEPVRIRFLSTDGGTPLKVRSMCLPFVHVVGAAGEPRMLDLRCCSIARLERKFARRAWKALKKAARSRPCPGCSP